MVSFKNKKKIINYDKLTSIKRLQEGSQTGHVLKLCAILCLDDAVQHRVCGPQCLRFGPGLAQEVEIGK